MDSWATSIFNCKYPVKITKFITHAGYWVTSLPGDYIYINPHYKQIGDDEPAALYMIHGTADYAGSLRPLAQLFMKAAIPSNIKFIVLPNFSDRFRGKSIEAFADELSDNINRYGFKQVYGVGHSRGGLVMTYWAENLARQRGVDVIALMSYGTPYSGSALAAFPSSWLSTSVRQMQIGSIFLANLKQQILNSSIPYFFVAARSDEIVAIDSAIIREYCILHPDSSYETERNHGHLSVLSSHRVIEKIEQFLAQFCPKKALVTATDEEDVMLSYHCE